MKTAFFASFAVAAGLSASTPAWAQTLADAKSAPTAAQSGSSAAPATLPKGDQSQPVKVSFRLLVDGYRKNFSDSAYNLKQPQLASMRFKLEHRPTEDSYADLELRPNEVEFPYNFTTGANKDAPPQENLSALTINNLVRYFHLVYRFPLEGYTIGYVREYEPSTGGYLGLYSLLANGVPSLQTHNTRIEAVRVEAMPISHSRLKFTYYLARDQSVAISVAKNGNNASSASDRGFYHRLVAGSALGDFNLEAGAGYQTVFLNNLGAQKNSTESTNDLILHSQLEFVGVKNLKALVGLGRDSYAAKKLNNEKGSSVSTTYVAAGQYELIPKTLKLYTEYSVHSVKLADKTQNNYKKPLAGPAGKYEETNAFIEQALVVALQFYTDSRLSIIPQYSLYLNNVDASYRKANSDGSISTISGSSSSVVSKRLALTSGTNHSPTATESQVAVRLNYQM